MNYEETLRAELAAVRAQQNELAKQADHLEKLLDSPRVEPVLCFWRYHSYCEEESFSDTVDEAFGELEGMEEYGSASTVGVRIGGHLITWKEWQGKPRLPWDDDDAICRDSNERYRKGEYVSD